MKRKIVWIYFDFNGFSTQFLHTITKTLTLSSTKALSQEDSKFVDLVLHGAKTVLFFTSNIIILQSM
jgi:hypothetical protein